MTIRSTQSNKVTRIRLTRDEMAAEAIRLATVFVSTLPNADSARCVGVGPDMVAPMSNASKYPVEWNVCFVFYPPDVVMDGGEMFVSVNLETGSVGVREY